MARKPKRVEIDSRYYDIFCMSPKSSIRVLTRLAKIVGGPLGIMGDLIFSSEVENEVQTGDEEQKGKLERMLDKPLPPGALEKAVRTLIERLDEDEVVMTIETVLEPVHVQGEGDKGTRPIRFETDFQGRILHLFKVLVAVLEENYSDFLGESTGGLAGVLVRMGQT